MYRATTSTTWRARDGEMAARRSSASHGDGPRSRGRPSRTRSPRGRRAAGQRRARSRGRSGSSPCGGGSTPLFEWLPLAALVKIEGEASIGIGTTSLSGPSSTLRKRRRRPAPRPVCGPATVARGGSTPASAAARRRLWNPSMSDESRAPTASSPASPTSAPTDFQRFAGGKLVTDLPRPITALRCRPAPLEDLNLVPKMIFPVDDLARATSDSATTARRTTTSRTCARRRRRRRRPRRAVRAPSPSSTARQEPRSSAWRACTRAAGRADDDEDGGHEPARATAAASSMRPPTRALGAARRRRVVKPTANAPPTSSSAPRRAGEPRAALTWARRDVLCAPVVRTNINRRGYGAPSSRTDVFKAGRPRRPRATRGAPLARGGLGAAASRTRASSATTRACSS